MVKHVVLWKLDNSYSESEKVELLSELRNRLLDLENKIEELLHIEVYLNDKAAISANYDIVLDTVFNNFDALSKYQTHPEHVKVGGFLKKLKLQRSAIDYSF